jgi:hypothetical protein
MADDPGQPSTQMPWPLRIWPLAVMAVAVTTALVLLAVLIDSDVSRVLPAIAGAAGTIALAVVTMRLSIREPAHQDRLRLADCRGRASYHGIGRCLQRKPRQRLGPPSPAVDRLGVAQQALIDTHTPAVRSADWCLAVRPVVATERADRRARLRVNKPPHIQRRVWVVGRAAPCDGWVTAEGAPGWVW